MYFEIEPVQWIKWPKDSRDWLTDGPHVSSRAHCLRGILSQGMVSPGHFVAQGSLSLGWIISGRIVLGHIVSRNIVFGQVVSGHHVPSLQLSQIWIIYLLWYRLQFSGLLSRMKRNSIYFNQMVYSESLNIEIIFWKLRLDSYPYFCAW